MGPISIDDPLGAVSYAARNRVLALPWLFAPTVLRMVPDQDASKNQVVATAVRQSHGTRTACIEISMP
jgi:hypothetical protein